MSSALALIAGDRVSQEYEAPYRFTGGEILGVATDVSEESYRNLNTTRQLLPWHVTRRVERR